MEQTERSDALIHRHNYLNFSSWGVKFCKECKACHVKTCLLSFKRSLAQIEHYSLPQKMAQPRGLKFGFRNKRDSTIYVVKTKV